MTAYFPVGEILRPWGRRGAFVLRPVGDDCECLLPGIEARLRGEEVSRRIVQAKVVSGKWVVEVEGVESIEEAEALRGKELLLPEECRPSLGPGEFRLGQALGWSVTDRERGDLGQVVDVMDRGPYHVLLVRDAAGRAVEIPLVRALGLEVDTGRGCVAVALPRPWPGLDEE